MTDAKEILTPEGGRFGAMQYFYYQIAEAAFVECVALSAEREQNSTSVDSSSTDWIEGQNLKERQLAASVRCIVFAGMCLEAAIYDYAAWHLPELVIAGLDKMDFLAKWRIIPLLIAKHQIPDGQLTHNTLRVLQSYRNKLVHAKSEDMKFGDALQVQLAKHIKNETDIASGYIIAMEAIIATSIEMDIHASMTINPLPRFIPARNGLIISSGSELPKELAPLIKKCLRRLDPT